MNSELDPTNGGEEFSWRSCNEAENSVDMVSRNTLPRDLGRYVQILRWRIDWNAASLPFDCDDSKRSFARAYKGHLATSATSVLKDRIFCWQVKDFLTNA